MKVMIMSYSKSSWYGNIDYIGKQYTVTREGKYGYEVKIGKETRNISKSDAVVI
ncbi:hypothetical protein [Clostridium hydrogenum]|uniref:hypothetical protein n=1 Tax=Clostridium hydrogenum TaxID=2855764 RepID=UPI001F3B1B77|nr:hypothetical protein [Clostridium hydrogenum]